MTADGFTAYTIRDECGMSSFQPHGSGPFVSYVGFVQNAGTTSSLAIMETFLAILFSHQDRNGPSRFLPIFACRGGPGSAAPRGGGPRGTQKLIFFSLPARTITKIFSKRFLCPHGPLRKYFRSVFSACTDLYENIFEALRIVSIVRDKVYLRILG